MLVLQTTNMFQVYIETIVFQHSYVWKCPDFSSKMSSFCFWFLTKKYLLSVAANTAGDVLRSSLKTLVSTSLQNIQLLSPWTRLEIVLISPLKYPVLSHLQMSCYCWEYQLWSPQTQLEMSGLLLEKYPLLVATNTTGDVRGRCWKHSAETSWPPGKYISSGLLKHSPEPRSRSRAVLLTAVKKPSCVKTEIPSEAQTEVHGPQIHFCFNQIHIFCSISDIFYSYLKKWLYEYLPAKCNCLLNAWFGVNTALQSYPWRDVVSCQQ